MCLSNTAGAASWKQTRGASSYETLWTSSGSNSGIHSLNTGKSFADWQWIGVQNTNECISFIPRIAFVGGVRVGIIQEGDGDSGSGDIRYVSATSFSITPGGGPNTSFKAVYGFNG